MNEHIKALLSDSRTQRFLILLFLMLLALYVVAFVYSSLAIPICISLLLTYLLAPVVNRFSESLPRGAVVTLMLGATLIVFAIAAMKIFPALYKELLYLIKQTPYAVDLVINKWVPFLKEFVLSFEIISEAAFDRMINEASSVSQLSDRAPQAFSTIWYSFPKLFSLLLYLFLIPLLTFFMLMHAKRLYERFLGYVPNDLQDLFQLLILRVDGTLRAVIKGQFLVAVTLGGLYIFGFSLLGLQAAIAIGMIAGICRIIPYLDIFVAFILGGIAILSNMQYPTQMLWLIVVILLVQAIDGMLITPRIIGEKSGLHPSVVIVSIVAFSNIWGFWGVLVAIPVVALAKSMWSAISEYYLSSNFFLGK